MSATAALARRVYDATYGRLFAALYERSLRRAERESLAAARAQLLSSARGRTLEIGAGTGLNLPHYGDDVELVLCEPFAPMAAQLRKRLSQSGRTAEIVSAPAEALPFPDASFDTVVSTLVLCTVERPADAVAEITRVLRPDGALLVVEHVRSRRPGLARIQRLMRGPWRLIGHGCRPDRETAASLRASGLLTGELENLELAGMPALIRPAIGGVARKASDAANG